MERTKWMKIVGSTALACFAVWALAFVPDIAQAQGKVEYKWRFGSAWTQKVRNDSIQIYCDLVNKYSNGRIQITFKPSGQLGTHDEIFHAVREGSIEFGVYAPYVNLIPGGMLNWMPWTVGTYEEAAIAYAPPNGILYKVMDKAYEEVGHKLLWSSPMGPYGIGNKVRPIKTPDDFKNLKLRVSASLGFVRTLENMGKGSGMTLQTIPWADLYNALQTGVIDGCWSLWGSLVEERHFEVLKYYTALDWAWDSCNIAMNRKVWDKLPQDLKDAIFKAGREAEARDYRERKKTDEEYKQKVASAGLILYEPTAAEREVFRKKANMPAVWEELAKPWLEKTYPGQNMTKKVQDELEKVIAQAAKKK
jgi:TRAP-type C4-dicarboxylate transport system substrate-binding protein